MENNVKKTNIPWMAEIPYNWNASRIKNIFTEIDDKSETGTEELLSVSHYTGVTKRIDNIENETDFITNAKTLVGYKKVAENDLISNIMLAWNGSLGISKYNGITSPAYCVYRIKEGNNPNYYGFLFSTEFMKAEFRKKSFGIIDSRLRLYSDKFFSIYVPIPPLQEQKAIADYLDKKIEKIEKFIHQKTRLIALLKEKRQGVIDKAVSRGKKIKLKYLTKEPLQYGLNIEARFYKNKGIRFLRTSDLDDEGSIIGKGIYLYKELVSDEYLLKKGDILFSRSGTIGRTYFHKTDEPMTYAGFLVRFRLEDIELAKWVYYYSKTPEFKNILHSEAIESTIKNFNGKKYNNIKIPLPPLQEQKTIVQHIQTETAKIDQAIGKAQKEIELIKEYKEAMIAEAVVGKLNDKILSNRSEILNS